ncbi:MAG: hypothetical protein M0Z34_10660 [Nitrospiraceae bacterium]|nr:hypothetical protein [Nitrospiraceae bacterium]
MRASPTVFAPDKKPWYLRTWAISVAVVIALAIVVISDYPRAANKADRASVYAALQTEIWGDVQSCNASLNDTIIAVGEILSHQSTDTVTANEIATTNEPNCNPSGSSDLLDLASINVPNLLVNYKIKTIVFDLDNWAFPNAAAIINDLKGLLAHPNSTSLRADILQRQQLMDQLASESQAMMDANSHTLGVPTKQLKLINVKDYPAAILR